MSSKHTTGPWAYSHGGRPDFFYIDSPEGDVVYVTGSLQPNHAEANARLIAAAPELLTALEECLSALNFVVEEGGGPHCEHEGGTCFCKENNAISSALEAIAKATGEGA